LSHALSNVNPPPRPHSSASIGRPRLVAAASDSSANGPISRPLSIHVIGHTETERPRSMLGEWSQRLELQRQQSRDNTANAAGTVPFPSVRPQNEVSRPREEHGFDRQDRYRSTSVSNRQMDANKALSSIQSLKDLKAQKEDRTDNGHDHPPRPPSAASDRPLFTRPKSVLSMRSNGAPSRTISTTSDTLEHIYGNGNARDMRAKSPLGLRQPATGPERPAISQHGQTPRAAIERPAVVYLPSAEHDVPARPPPQKTWSLSYQMELLNKRKKPEAPKLGDVGTTLPVDPSCPASSEVPAVADPPEAQLGVIGTIEGVPIESIAEPEAQPISNVDEIHSNEVVGAPDQPVAFPTQTPPEDTASVPSTKDSLVHPPTNAIDAHSAVNTEETRSRTISSSKVHEAATSAPQARTISASKMPVRPPSRSTHTQPAGFVPKRAVKNSITQPTKSQMARTQAVVNEKLAAATKSGTGLAASTAAKSSQVSTKQNENHAKGAAAPRTGGFKPTSKADPMTTFGANTQARDGPRKPPVPTVSSLVKAHAARREAGLANVKVKLGSAQNPSAHGTTAPRSRSQATASSKRVIRSVDANASKNPSTGPAQVPLAVIPKEQTATAPVPNLTVR